MRSSPWHENFDSQEAAVDAKLMFARAIERLLDSRPLEAITVGDIVNESGLSKSCFYNHFSDKYELVNWWHEKTHDRNMGAFLAGTRSYREMIEKSLEDMMRNRSVYEHSLGKDDYEALRNHMKRLSVAAMRDIFGTAGIGSGDRATTLLMEMHADGACGAIFRWLRGDLDMDAHALAGIIERSLPAELSSALSARQTPAA